MSTKDGNDSQEKRLAHEQPTLKSADGLEVRNASVSDVSAVEAKRTNASDGSLREKQQERARRIQEQDESIQIMGMDGIAASRQNRVTEKDLLVGKNSRKEQESQVVDSSGKAGGAQVDKTRLNLPGGESFAVPRAESSVEPRSDSIQVGGRLYGREEVLASNNVQPDVVTDATSAKSSDVSQESAVLKGYVSTDAWSEVARLPEKTQAEIIANAIRSHVEHWSHETSERALGALIGSVQGVGAVLEDMAVIVDFSAACMIGDKETASKMGEAAGVSIAKTITGGVKLFSLSESYLESLGAEGDWLKPCKDIKALGDALNKQWDALPPREQERLRFEFLVEAGVSAASPAITSKLVKASKFTEILEISGQIGGNLSHELGPAARVLKERAAALVDSLPTVGTKRGLQPALADGVELSASALNAGEKAEKVENVVYSKALNPWEKAITNSEGRSVGIRGDHDPYCPLHPKGWRKSFINAEGDLEPANPSGLWKGVEITVENHIDGGWRKHLKGSSPFTSFSVTDGITGRYGDGKTAVNLELKALRAAIAAGEVPGVSIVEHSALVKSIIESPALTSFAKAKQLRNVIRDHEILVRGTIPKRFIEVSK